MSAGKVGALAVMDACNVRGSGIDRAGLAEARAAVAELITADVELDDATAALHSGRKPGDVVDAMHPDVLQFLAAQERRARALARVQPCSDDIYVAPERGTPPAINTGD